MTTLADAVHTMLAELHSSWERRPAQMRALYILMFEALPPVPFLRDHMASLHRDLRRAI